MSGLKEFFQQVEAAKERLNNDQLTIAEFWKQLDKPEKENWLKVIQKELDFDDIEINLADLSTSSDKECAYMEERRLPELGEQCRISYHDPYTHLYHTNIPLTQIENAWNISLRGIVYPVKEKIVSKKEVIDKEEEEGEEKEEVVVRSDTCYLTYTPNILKELEQRYLLQNEDIRPYLREKNIEKLVTLVVNRTEIIDDLSEAEQVELLTLTDGSSKQFLYQLALKMNDANELEKLIDKVMALLPPAVFKQLISYQEKGKKTLLATVSEIFPESSANSLKDKLTPKKASEKASDIKSEIDTHQDSIHTSVDFSLIQVFKRFAENYKIEGVTTVLEPENREIIITDYNQLDKPTEQLLIDLIEKINQFLELTDDALLKELNRGNALLYKLKDVETFKQNLEISLRFITSILKGDRFGSESHSLDPKSINTIGLSLQHIVAVTYWGLLSASNPESDAKNFLHYVKHLKEIMREYSKGDHAPDKNKCQGGTINHLVKALDGIAPDVTVADVKKEDIQNETNELWHRYLIEKMKDDPALCKQVNRSLLQKNDLTNLVEAHFPSFLEYALPHLHKNYHHIVLDEEKYTFFLKNEDNLISAITFGLTRDKTLMREFESHCNKTEILKEMELTTYLTLLKQGKVPYYFHDEKNGTISFIESIVTSKNIPIETALVCFEELDESFQPILLNTFKRCFGEEALIQVFLDAKNIKLLKRIDPGLKKTETILEQMHSMDRINCYIACFSQNEDQLAPVFLTCKEVNTPLNISENGKDYQDYPLLYEMQHGLSSSRAKALLDMGANITIKNDKNECFLDYYFQNRSIQDEISPNDLIKNCPKEKETLLEYFLRYLDLEFVYQLLDGPDFESIEKLPKNDHTDKLFKLALEKGKSKLAIRLLRPENVNEPSKTVIHEKETYYDVHFTGMKSVEKPIEYPIHRAIQLEDHELIRAIVQAGARLTDKDASGRTPLTLALELGLFSKNILPNEFLEKSIRDVIYEKKYELLEKVDPEHTIIDRLLQKNELKITSSLFCDILEKGPKKLAKLILEKIDDKESLIKPVVINEKIYNPLFSAIKAENPELVKLLLEFNVDVAVIKKSNREVEFAEKVLGRLPESESKKNIIGLFEDHNVWKKTCEFFEKEKIYHLFDLKNEKDLEFIRGMIPTLNDLIKAISEQHLVVAEIFAKSILEKNPGKFTDRQNNSLIDAFQSLIFCECRSLSKNIDFTPFIRNLVTLGLKIDQSLIEKILLHLNIVGATINENLATAIIKNHDGCLKDNPSLRMKLYHKLIASDNVDAFRYLFLTFEDNQLLPSLNLNLEQLDSNIAGFLFDSGYLKFEKENRYQISGCRSKSYSDKFVKKVISGNNLKMLESLLENSLNVKNFDANNKRTLLMRLVQMNSDRTDIFTNVFEKILEKEKYDPSPSLFSKKIFAKGKYGTPTYINLKEDITKYSALHHAINSDNLLAIRLLLKHGATPDARAKCFMEKKGINWESVGSAKLFF